MKYLCFDAGPELIDRYTVFYKNSGWQPWQYYIAASTRPFHPQGFGQHGEVPGFWKRAEAAHIGQPIRFAKLPPDVQRFALNQAQEG